MKHRSLLILVVAFLACLPAGPALAHGSASLDPKLNFRVGGLPASCTQAGSSAACLDAAVASLDHARASLGHGPYLLPSDILWQFNGSGALAMGASAGLGSGCYQDYGLGWLSGLRDDRGRG